MIEPRPRPPALDLPRVYSQLVSWLLVSAIPTLLMLATVGLERIETGLNRAGAAAARATVLLDPGVDHGEVNAD